MTTVTDDNGGAPVIGLSAYSAQARWGVWDAESVLLPRSYVDAVVRGGGVPVVLPPLPGVIEAVLPRLDGLLLTGGPDVEPARYGAEAGPDTQPPRVQRDAAELALLAAAVDGGLPVLGICRGMQVLNVLRGGTLIQHLPDVVGTDLHCPSPGVYGEHEVRVAPGSRLATVLSGPYGSLDGYARGVPTYHHQGIDRLGDGLVATAWAADDVIEAIEDESLLFCVGVQWHPEAGDDPGVFEGLVRAAAAARKSPVRLTAGR